MSPVPDEAGELLRSRGLRSTPQRRAILKVFRGGASEHLSADEVHARAAESLPDLSRGTVYATLAEFSELGLLAASGAPEPVRYEINTTQHSHFRCRLCLRLFDLTSGVQEPEVITDRGFVVERVDTRAEGICFDCNEYDKGLKAGVWSISRTGPTSSAIEASGSAAMEADGPLGTMVLAASPNGLTRLAFEDHADFDQLRAWAAHRRGSRRARQQLTTAIENVTRYLAGDPTPLAWEVDTSHIGSHTVEALRCTTLIPYAARRSYSELPLELPARELGRIMGSNPIPLVAPCHRVTRGSERPATYVGGTTRRRWLENLERTNPDARGR